MPLRTRRDFFPRQTDLQTPFRELNRARDYTESLCRRFPSRACSPADLLPQPSANKEQRHPDLRKKKLHEGSAPVSGVAVLVPSTDIGFPIESKFVVARCSDQHRRRARSPIQTADEHQWMSMFDV